MSKSQLAEAMSANRSESITRRPAGSPMPGPGNAASRMAGLANLAGASMIPVDRIMADPDQPRKEFDPEALNRLAESLKSRGQLQPIRVRWSEETSCYVVIVGERRWRASQIAGLKSLAAIIESDKDRVTPVNLLQDQLVENALREDLKPVEQARAYRTLMTARGWSLRDLAEQLSIHHSAVHQALSLLDLPEPVQASIDNGSLKASSARAIATLEDPAEQVALATRVVDEGMKLAEVVEEVERIAPKARKASVGKGRGSSKGKPAKLPTERTVKLDGGFKVVVTGRKGFDGAALLAMLEEAAAKVRAEVESSEVAA